MASVEYRKPTYGQFPASSIAWPVVAIQSPASLGLNITVPSGIPEPSTGPGDPPASNVPTAIFETVDTSAAPVSHVVTILVPPTISISDITMTIPDLNVNIPEANIVWAYEAYTSAIMASIQIQAANIDNLFDNLWTDWQNKQNSIWAQGSSFNLVETMGYTDVMTSYRLKEIAYGKMLYDNRYTYLREEQRLKNLQVYINTMLSSERQKRGQHSQQKDLELVWAKDMVTKSIEAYNLAIKAYAARIVRYKMESDKFRAVIEQNDLRLKAFEQLISIEQLKLTVNKGLIERYKIEVAVQVALIELYKAQMDVVRLIAEIQAIEVDIYRLGVEAFISQIKQISEAANQQAISADITAMQAELGMASVWAADLAARQEALSAELTAAQNRLTYASKGYDEKTNAMGEQDDAYSDQADSLSDYFEQQITTADAREALAEYREDVEVSMSQAHIDAFGKTAAHDAAIAGEQAQTQDTIKNSEVAHISTTMQAETDNLKFNQEIAELLKNAKLINNFTEYYE